MEAIPNTWEDIEERHRSLPEGSPIAAAMIPLVQQIMASELRTVLHPWTQMFELRVTPNSVDPWQGGAFLNIRVMDDGKVEFAYIDTEVKQKQWRRVTTPSGAFNLLEKFVDQLSWRIRYQS